MSKQIVRVKDSYPNREFVGEEAVIIKDKRLSNNSVLLGFPLDSPFGWYDSDYNTEYRCWWIEKEYLENVTTITRSKFR